MQITQKPDGTISFKLTIPWQELTSTYQTILTNTAKHVTIPGFRKGKAPLQLVEKRLDQDKLYTQALEKILPSKYQAVILKNNLQPLIPPQFTPFKTEKGKDWVFKVETACQPEIEIGDYKTYLKKALSTKSSKKQTKDRHEENEKLTKLFDTLLAKAKLSVSPLLIEHEYKHQLSHLIQQLNSLKITIQDYAKSLKKTTKELIAEYKKTAETNLKLEFILAKLIELENPNVDAELKKLSPSANQKQHLKYSLQRQKLIDNLLKL